MALNPENWHYAVDCLPLIALLLLLILVERMTRRKKK